MICAAYLGKLDVQNGTSLQELQLFGGWSNLTMVLRYAHLSSSHLQIAANRINVTNSLHGGTMTRNSLSAIPCNMLKIKENLVGPLGLEPRTKGL